MFNRFRKKVDDDEPPPPFLRVAARYVIIEQEPEPEPEPTPKRRIRVPLKVRYAVQTILVLLVGSLGILFMFNAVFAEQYEEAGREPTATSTPPPPLPTTTRLPTATYTKTPWPTLVPEGRGRALADVFTSSYGGYDNRFATRLMGTKEDFEEYLLCFNGEGYHRHLDGVEESGYWGTWENIDDEEGFCIPGIFYSVSRVSDILITSDVLHSIGLSEAEWLQIDVHIYANGPPPNYWVFCPAGVVADTSKFCLGSS